MNSGEKSGFFDPLMKRFRRKDQVTPEEGIAAAEEQARKKADLLVPETEFQDWLGCVWQKSPKEPSPEDSEAYFWFTKYKSRLTVLMGKAGLSFAENIEPNQILEFPVPEIPKVSGGFSDTFAAYGYIKPRSGKIRGRVMQPPVYLSWEYNGKRHSTLYMQGVIESIENDMTTTG